MKTKKASLIVTLMCALIICVFSGASIYAMILYNHGNRSSITFTATSVSGNISASMTGLTTNPANISQSFNAYSGNTESFTLNGFSLGTVAAPVELAESATPKVTITIVIQNTSPDVKMNVSMVSISNTQSFVLKVKQDSGTATQVSAATYTLTPVNSANHGTNSTTLTITIEPGNVDALQGTVAFNLSLTRGASQPS